MVLRNKLRSSIMGVGVIGLCALEPYFLMISFANDSKPTSIIEERYSIYSGSNSFPICVKELGGIERLIDSNEETTESFLDGYISVEDARMCLEKKGYNKESYLNSDHMRRLTPKITSE